MASKVTLESKISINRNIVWRVVDNEAVILNVDNSGYFTLNSIGTDIWESIKPAKTVKEIVSIISAKYDVQENNLIKDIIKLLSELEKEGLILSK